MPTRIVTGPGGVVVTSGGEPVVVNLPEPVGSIAATKHKAVAVATGVVHPRGAIGATTRKAVASLTGAGVPNDQHYSDDFNRTNSTTSAGTNWTNRLNVVGINTNAAYAVTADVNSYATYNSTMSTDDHSVTVTAGTMQGTEGVLSDNLYCILGADTAGECASLAFSNYSAGPTAAIYSRTAWGSSTIQAWVSGVTFATADTITLSRSGNVYTATQNGAAIGSGLSWTDSSNIVPRDSSHRYVGVGGRNSSSAYRRIDSFAADDI